MTAANGRAKQLTTESTVEIVKENDHWSVSVVTKGIFKFGDAGLSGSTPTQKRGFSTKAEAIDYAAVVVRAPLQTFTG